MTQPQPLARPLNLLLALAATTAAATAPAADDFPLEPVTPLVYNHDRDLPLALDMVNVTDLEFLDWDGDGDQDLFGVGAFQFVLFENIGSPQEPRFANSFHHAKTLFEDQRIGRFVAPTSRPGTAGHREGAVSMLGFTRHARTPDVGTAPLQLWMYTPPQGGEGEWRVTPVYDEAGNELKNFQDTWFCPTVAAGDLNGDGKDDLVVGTSHPGSVLRVGRIAGGFKNPGENYDRYSSRLYILYNISEGDQLTFADPVMIHADDGPVTAYGYIYQRLIDVDEDGLLDLVVGTHKLGIKWYRNTGEPDDPAFTAAGPFRDADGRPLESSFTFRPFFADLDDDGRAEMMTATYFGCTSRLQRYDRQSAEKTLASGWGFNGTLSMAGSPDTPVTAQSIATAEPYDWDGDGDLDLVVGSEPAATAVIINEGTMSRPVWATPERLKFVDGSPIEYYSIEVGRGSVWGPVEHYIERTQPRLADWNGDGVTDIVTGSMGMRQLLLEGKQVEGELRFERPVALSLNGSPLDAAHRVQPAVLDYDGDGHRDLIALDTRNVVTLWPGDGTPDLKPPQPMQTQSGEPLQMSGYGLAISGGRKALNMTDWDGDGTLDLIVYRTFADKGPAGVLLYRGTDQPLRFEDPVQLHPPISFHTAGIGLTDWNNDGYMDVVIGGDHRPLRAESGPRGQFFILSGRDLPVPPTRRTPKSGRGE